MSHPQSYTLNGIHPQRWAMSHPQSYSLNGIHPQRCVPVSPTPTLSLYDSLDRISSRRHRSIDQDQVVKCIKTATVATDRGKTLQQGFD